MDKNFEEKKRKIIPRWRDFQTTLSLGELESTGKPIPVKVSVPIDALNEQMVDWQKHKSLAFASDLVGSAFVLGISDSIEEAAAFILSKDSAANDLQRRVASQAIEPEFRRPIDRISKTPDSQEIIIDLSKNNVRRYREQLKKSLRNPVKLVELSREFATLGSIEKALRTMDMAVTLGSANRFVLRSAARLYVHCGEIEKAHFILRKAPSLRTDPWLLAAEIAISSMRNLTSRHVRKGKQCMDDTNYNPFELSELTCALATLELDNANSKLARKLFRRSLKKPTDNSLAQVEWATREIQNFNIEFSSEDVPLIFEARSRNYFKIGAYGDAIDQGNKWMGDQPFALTPVFFTGMVANLIEDFDVSKSVYKFGLQANPQNAILRNNLAFALASNNEPLLAQYELERIDRTSLRNDELICITATEGLVNFRQGDDIKGRALYERAIRIAEEKNEPACLLRALLYLAREEVYLKTAFAKSAVEKVSLEAKKFQHNSELEIMIERLTSRLGYD